jgi:GT2 family glycosyltransferase
VEYTVIGKTPVPPTVLADRDRLSLVILGRGGRPFRADSLTDLARYDAAEILTMESGDPVPDSENLTDRHPNARFYFVRGGAGTGDLVNLAASEIQTEYFLVLWSDTRLLPPVLSSRLLYSLMESPALCQVPLIVDPQGNPEPSRSVPAPGSGGTLETWFTVADDNEKDTLYPYDYTGFYKREPFLRTGGFDTAYENPYWQKLDFGFRCRMMGHRIFQNNSIRLVHNGQYPMVENTTRDADYPRFVLKNILPRFRQDRLFLPGSRFFSWWRLSGLPFRVARREFLRAAEDIRREQGLYRTDFSLILETWDSLS